MNFVFFSHSLPKEVVWNFFVDCGWWVIWYDCVVIFKSFQWKCVLFLLTPTKHMVTTGRRIKGCVIVLLLVVQEGCILWTFWEMLSFRNVCYCIALYRMSVIVYILFDYCWFFFFSFLYLIYLLIRTSTFKALKDIT